MAYRDMLFLSDSNIVTRWQAHVTPHAVLYWRRDISLETCNIKIDDNGTLKCKIREIVGNQLERKKLVNVKKALNRQETMRVTPDSLLLKLLLHPELNFPKKLRVSCTGTEHMVAFYRRHSFRSCALSKTADDLNTVTQNSSSFSAVLYSFNNQHGKNGTRSWRPPFQYRSVRWGVVWSFRKILFSKRSFLYHEWN